MALSVNRRYRCPDKPNLFVKPDEQSQTCLNFAMAKKGLMKLNLFVKPKAEAKIIWVMLRREKDY
jgi:hypothetical protein